MEEEKAGEGNGEREFVLFLLAVVGRGPWAVGWGFGVIIRARVKGDHRCEEMR
jgi:hypothetical protein